MQKWLFRLREIEYRLHNQVYEAVCCGGTWGLFVWVHLLVAYKVLIQPVVFLERIVDKCRRPVNYDGDDIPF